MRSQKYKDENMSLFLLRWAARTGSLLILVLLALFAFGDSNGLTTSITATEAVGLFFFPFGLAVGLLLGWKNELLGGIFTLLSLSGIYLIFGVALTGKLPGGPYFLLFATPGFMFLLYGLLSRIGPRNAHATR